MPRAFRDDERRLARERLLAAGRAALPRTGFRRTAVEDLTRAAGISKGAFYLFFDSKEALWVALLQESEGAARAGIEAAIADPAPGRLGRVLDRIFHTAWADPVLATLADPAELAWLERALPDALLGDAREDDERWFRALWLRLVALGDADGAVPAEVFAGLPNAALAIARLRTELGVGRAEAVARVVVEGLELRLRAR